MTTYCLPTGLNVHKIGTDIAIHILNISFGKKKIRVITNVLRIDPEKSTHSVV